MKVVSSRIFGIAEDGKPTILLEEAYLQENEAEPTDHIADGSKIIKIVGGVATARIKLNGSWGDLQ